MIAVALDLDCPCGEPTESVPDCVRCGDPRTYVPTCERCAQATWRGLCARCTQADALVELEALPAAITHAVANLVEEPVEVASSRYDDRIRQMELDELREDWHQRAQAVHHKAQLDVERIEGGNHEGWAHDRQRDAKGKPLRGVGKIPPLSARGHIERATRGFRLRKSAQHIERSKGAKRWANNLRAKCEREKALGFGDDGILFTEERAEYFEEKIAAYESTSVWHRGRGRGQRERFHELANCGKGYAQIRCKRCEWSNLKTGGTKGQRVRQIGCSINRACVGCRDRRAGERRAQFWRAREFVLDDYKRRGLTRRKRKGGRWGEKDFTLTLPDKLIDGGHIVERRILVLFSAWRTFNKKLAAHWSSRKRRAGDHALRQKIRPVWHAAFETTPGADGLGHPHWHVWMVSPFIRQEDIRRWWAESLQKEGIAVSASQLIQPVLREVKCANIVNEVYKGKDRIRIVPKEPKRVAKQDAKAGGRPHHVNYIEGWTIDTKGKHGGPSMSANTQARVYMALEGKRTVRCTRGFLAKGYKANACPACGFDHIVVNSVTGECVPALFATVVTWRSPLWVERGPPICGAPRKAKPRQQEQHHAKAIRA